MTETAEIVGKMVYALEKRSKSYALGYLETFMTGLINEYVTDPVKLEMLRTRMLAIGIDALLDAAIDEAKK